MLLALAFTACDDNDADEDADDAIVEGEDRGADLASATQTETSGADPETIIGMSGAILIAINEGEIMMAQIALDDAEEDIVLDYAQRMVDEHTANLEATQALLDDVGVAPINNIVAESIRSDADDSLRLLEVTSDLDHDYMVTQVMMHSEALVIMDTLIELAPLEVVQSFFVDTRATIQAHRDDAEDILRSLD